MVLVVIVLDFLYVIERLTVVFDFLLLTTTTLQRLARWGPPVLRTSRTLELEDVNTFRTQK